MKAARSVKSARRVLAVLDLYEKLRRPASVGEVATLLDFPQSSTSFLMNDLRRLGYLNYDSRTRRFAPTMRVALLGGWIQAGTVGRAEMAGLLARVCKRTQLTTLLCTQSGVEVQYIHVSEGRGPATVMLGPGALRPICRSAPGHVLLAELSDADVGRIVRMINAASQGTKREDLERTLRLVRRTRRDGYAWAAGQVFPDFGGVAVRLPFNDILDKPLVLAVAGPVSRIRTRHRQLAALLKQETAVATAD